eukprot:scaffold8450_cov21-Tisochrysis_lutea.AAC.7
MEVNSSNTASDAHRGMHRNEDAHMHAEGSTGTSHWTHTGDLEGTAAGHQQAAGHQHSFGMASPKGLPDQVRKHGP